MVEMARLEGGPRRWLVVMAKEPRCGAVKTRLSRDIGAVAATRFYRNIFANVCRRLVPDPRWRTIIAVSPDRATGSALWPEGAAIIPQGPGDLGARLQRVLDWLAPGPAIIIGTDIPEINAERIAAAFRLLRSHDAVFGPCDDGGYWMVGLRRSPRVRAIFADVRWSSAHTLADTRANLKGACVALTHPLEDVDDGASYRRLGAAGARVILPGQRHREDTRQAPDNDQRGGIIL
ncbi:2-phospho-L-lactate guanylyltransferase [bacterium BMS3Bbin10]|nr:2-phospho-L-lactate guanylyltransferase [bacterium BMS3Bbin10]